MQSGKEKTVFIFEAEEGMILARDVYSPGGHMIVPQGLHSRMILSTQSLTITFSRYLYMMEFREQIQSLLTLTSSVQLLSLPNSQKNITAPFPL